jgi:hypothetical protein
MPTIKHNRVQKSKDLVALQAVPKDQESYDPKPVGWGSYNDTMSFDRDGVIMNAKTADVE